MLSPIQKEIVETSGNLIVRASAGTGKTHTMVSKIKHDIEKKSYTQSSSRNYIYN